MSIKPIFVVILSLVLVRKDPAHIWQWERRKVKIFKNRSLQLEYGQLYQPVRFEQVWFRWTSEVFVVIRYQRLLRLIEPHRRLEEFSRRQFPVVLGKKIFRFTFRASNMLGLFLMRKKSSRLLTVASNASVNGNNLRMRLWHFTTIYSTLVNSVSIYSHFCFEFPINRETRKIPYLSFEITICVLLSLFTFDGRCLCYPRFSW